MNKRKLKKKIIQLFKIKVISKDSFGYKTCVVSKASRTIKYKLFMKRCSKDFAPGQVLLMTPRGLHE